MESSSGAAYNAGDKASLRASGIRADLLTFYYHMYGGNIGTLAVKVLHNGTWHTVWEKSGQQHRGTTFDWSKAAVNLGPYTGTIDVMFEATAAGGYRGDIALDEIKLTENASYQKRFEYDALGRLVEVIDDINGDRVYTYDAAGNRTVVEVNN